MAVTAAHMLARSARMVGRTAGALMVGAGLVGAVSCITAAAARMRTGRGAMAAGTRGIIVRRSDATHDSGAGSLGAFVQAGEELGHEFWMAEDRRQVGGGWAIEESGYLIGMM